MASADARASVQQACARRARSPWISITAVWRDAITTFGAHAAPILLYAMIGFAGPSVLGLALIAPSIETFIRSQATFCAFQESAGWLLLKVGVFGLLANTFTEGMVAFIALQEALTAADHDRYTTRLRSACHITLMRFPKLLLVGVVYVACMAIAMVGLTVPLTELHLDPVQLHAGISYDHPLELMGREVTALSVNVFIPNPGVLLCGLAASQQTKISGGSVNFVAVDKPWRPVYAYPSTINHVDPIEFWLITFGSVVLIIVIKTLLRFRVVAALTSGNSSGEFRSIGSVKTAIAASARLGWQNFFVVTIHVWLLRVLMACSQILFVAMPVLFVERIVIPRMTQLIGITWMYPMSMMLIVVSAALVNSILTAFAVVYDAQLFAVATWPRGGWEIALPLSSL